MTNRLRPKKRNILGTTDRPRLSICRTLNNIHAQVIDDSCGKTLAAASSVKIKHGGNVVAAQQVGKTVAENAKAAGVSKVVFDRGPAKYHGRVKALAEAAREGGLLF